MRIGSRTALGFVLGVGARRKNEACARGGRGSGMPRWRQGRGMGNALGAENEDEEECEEKLDTPAHGPDGEESSLIH
jgi:hypothetical protein